MKAGGRKKENKKEEKKESRAWGGSDPLEKNECLCVCMYIVCVRVCVIAPVGEELLPSPGTAHLRPHQQRRQLTC